jgi:inosine-uridine nucleoside N-ribohydrolase
MSVLISLQIPVYGGASKSLIWIPPSDKYFGEDGFRYFEFPNHPNPDDYLQDEHAVNALIRTLTQNPGTYETNYQVHCTVLSVRACAVNIATCTQPELSNRTGSSVESNWL